MVTRPAKKPCQACGKRPKWSTRQKCYPCWIRTQGITERVAARDARAAMVPEELRKRVVPERLWPPATRWCAGCQSFVDLEDVGRGASQCKTCVSAKGHSAMVVKTYGLEVSDYDRLFQLQGGKCAICRARPKKTRLAVDHDHKTGEVRGLVCKNCNHDLLGGAHDNVDILWAAVHYMVTPPNRGGWIAPEDRGEKRLSQFEPKTDDAQRPSKASRLVTGIHGPAQAETSGEQRPAHGMTVDELHLIGGSKDERGYYRIYQHRDDTRIPF